MRYGVLGSVWHLVTVQKTVAVSRGAGESQNKTLFAALLLKINKFFH